MHSNALQHPTSAPTHTLISIPAPTRPSTPSVVPLPTPRTIQLQHTTAVRRGAASCRVVLRSCPVTAAAVSSPRSRHGLPSAAAAATQARVGPSSRRSPASWPSRMSGRRPRRWSLCPRPLSTMRTDVRPTGRVDVRCPSVRCPRDRCDPGVRTDTRPVSAAAASKLSAPRWIPDVGAAGPATCGRSRVRRTAVGSVSGLVVAARIKLGGEGWSCVGRAWLARAATADLGRRLVRVQARAPRSPPGRSRELVQRQVPVGWPGSTGRSRCAHVAPQVRPGRLPA
jgi:hypothetical protein